MILSDLLKSYVGCIKLFKRNEKMALINIGKYDATNTFMIPRDDLSRDVISFKIGDYKYLEILLD